MHLLFQAQFKILYVCIILITVLSWQHGALQGLTYVETDGDEVEDLLRLLAFVKTALPGVEAVSSGAIASDYQRLRVEHVCINPKLGFRVSGET